MYNTGVDRFLAVASSPNRDIDTRVILSTPENNLVLTPNDIVSYKISDASVAGKYFTPGNFVATTLELSLNASSTTVSKIAFKTTAINSLSVEAGIRVRQVVYIPMGVFYLDADGISTENEGYVTIKATDLPPVMHETFDSNSLDFPCTVQAALEKLSLVMGITIHVSESDFPNLSAVLTKTFELSTTYREALRYIAETLGAYVCMGRDGSVHLEKIFKGVVDIGCTLDDNYLFSVNQQESTVEPFQYVSIRANDADIGVYQEITGVTTGREYSIYNNPFTFGHPEDFLEGLVQPISFTAFHPTKVAFHGRPDIDTGDVLEYVYKGTTYILPVCSHIFEYNGGFKTTVESIGSDALKVSPLDPGMKQQITAVRQNMNTLVRNLTQTQSQIIEINGELVEMSKILQTIDALQTQISKIEGDLTQVSTLTQTANQLRLDIQSVAKDLIDTNNKVNGNQQTILSYFDFQADGLTIGLSSSNIRLKLSNNQIQFLRDGSATPVAYFSEGQLYVTDAHFIRSLVLGNFEFVPRTNGNLSLKRRG
jgi:hypothetical protein